LSTAVGGPPGSACPARRAALRPARFLIESQGSGYAGIGGSSGRLAATSRGWSDARPRLPLRGYNFLYKIKIKIKIKT
jgi:hypothetical protein